MNSMRRVLRTEKEVKELVKQEVEKAYPEISKDVAYQSFAMCFYILNRDYGFGRKRLLDLKDKIIGDILSILIFAFSSPLIT